MNVLISTIYKGSATIQAIKLFKPQKIFFIIDDYNDSIRAHSVKMIKDLFPEISVVEIPIKMYDIVDIAKHTIEIINSESKNKIIVHISEGRKTMSLGVLFGAYVMMDKVDSAYYIIEETINISENAPLLIRD